jgi:hypothetical protein
MAEPVGRDKSAAIANDTGDARYGGDPATTPTNYLKLLRANFLLAALLRVCFSEVAAAVESTFEKGQFVYPKNDPATRRS